MYPAGDLKTLARQKAGLRLRIALRRRACVLESRLLVEPIEKIDLWRERLRNFGSYLPLGLVALAAWRQSRPAPEPAAPRRRGVLGWLSVAAQGIRAYRQMSGRT